MAIVQRKILIFGILALCAAALAIFVSINQKAHLKQVGITQIVSHPGLDEVRSGIKKALAHRGFVDGEAVAVIFRNANGDPSLTLPIAQEFVRRNVDVIVPITTPSALGAAKSTASIPIVFGGVTDPVGVGLVRSLSTPGGNITGTSDRWPFEDQLTLFTKLLPGLKRLGMMYRPGDDVSKIGVEAIQALSPKFGIDIVLRPVSSASDIYPTSVALFREVDAIYTGMDNLVVENLDALLKAAREANKPVLSGDEGSVSRGALAATAVNMTKLGELTGQMVADVLVGAKPATMPVRVLDSGDVVVNRAAAKHFGVSEETLRHLNAREL